MDTAGPIDTARPADTGVLDTAPPEDTATGDDTGDSTPVVDSGTTEDGPWHLDIVGTDWAGVHLGQTVYLHVVRDSDGAVVGSGSDLVDASGVVTFSFPGVLDAGERYWLDYFGDANFNGTCEPYPDDHVWHWDIGVPTGDTIASADHAPAYLDDAGCDTF